ncbi:MAG: hypothetical protein JXD22_03545 [Sedimentisphaerales bacterium]|nr:hypothetical protein [Sedimentisphaerales bacterium]
MNKRVIFETGWKSFFAQNQLCTFDDFFDYNRGQAVNQNSKRNVTVFELVENDPKKTFFMKRFIHPHFKDMLSAFCHFGKPCSQAEVEWRNANILLGHGIETYHPVCYGVKSCFGFEQRSFFITEQIKGRCLLDYLTESWADLEKVRREKLVLQLGKYFQHIHSARISLPDSYIWHIYMVKTTNNMDEFEFAMIDLHRMQIRTCSNRQAAKDLGGFLFSLPEGFMDETLRALFMDSYLENQRIKNTNTFRKQVERWKRKISNRRKRQIVQI